MGKGESRVKINKENKPKNQKIFDWNSSFFEAGILFSKTPNFFLLLLQQPYQKDLLEAL